MRMCSQSRDNGSIANPMMPHSESGLKNAISMCISGRGFENSRHTLPVNGGCLGIFAVILLVLSIGPASVQAIGITPGRTTMDFEPGLQKDVSFAVINNEKKDMKVLLYVKEGDLADIITLYNTLVDFSDDEESKSFRYTVKLPQAIEKPGKHTIEIVAKELPKNVEGAAPQVGATTAVITQLIIKVPYQGKYAEIELMIPTVNAGDPVTFFVKANNLGDQDILRAKARIEILGPTNEVIKVLETAEKPIGAKKREELLATWEGEINPGAYHAVATLDYDGKLARAEQNFAVGNMFIDVYSIEVSNFQLGGIAKFNIKVKSKWNQRIENVYGQMVIEDEDKKPIADFKTASIEVEPLGEGVLQGFWDTEGVKIGTYDARVVLHYGDKTTEKKLKTHIDLNAIRVDIMDVSVGAVTSIGKGLSENNYIMLLIIVLVVINAGWFLYLRRRKRPG